MQFLILGCGKIGIDLYIKLKKLNLPSKIIIFNKNKKSVGAQYCQKNFFNYSSGGVKDLSNYLNSTNNVIFDATSANASLLNFKFLEKKLKDNFYINLTPSPIGKYFIPYFKNAKIPRIINMITCGGQSSIPVIIEMKKRNKFIDYVELVSSISSQSAGRATRQNINEYLVNTNKAIKKLSKIKKSKVIMNLNPANPPVNMMNSIFFECKKIDKKKIKLAKISLQLVNKTIKNYIPGYNGRLFYQKGEDFFRVTVRVVGSGDYLSTFAGNLDIITSASSYIGKLIYEKNNH